MSIGGEQVYLDPKQNGQVTSVQAEGYCKVGDDLLIFYQR